MSARTFGSADSGTRRSSASGLRPSVRVIRLICSATPRSSHGEHRVLGIVLDRRTQLAGHLHPTIIAVRRSFCISAFKEPMRLRDFLLGMVGRLNRRRCSLRPAGSPPKHGKLSRPSGSAGRWECRSCGCRPFHPCTYHIGSAARKALSLAAPCRCCRRTRSASLEPVAFICTGLNWRTTLRQQLPER